jgi:hypothetical protein
MIHSIEIIFIAQCLTDTLDTFVPLNEMQRELRVNAARETVLQRVKRFAQDFVDLAEHCQYGAGHR